MQTTIEQWENAAGQLAIRWLVVENNVDHVIGNMLRLRSGECDALLSQIWSIDKKLKLITGLLKEDSTLNTDSLGELKAIVARVDDMRIVRNRVMHGLVVALGTKEGEVRLLQNGQTHVKHVEDVSNMANDARVLAAEFLARFSIIYPNPAVSY